MIQAMSETLSELQARLQRNQQAVSAAFAAIPAPRFYEHPPQVWSAAENLQHLTKSVRTATLAYRLPPRLSGLVWGQAHSSRSYAELVAMYKGALGTGVESPAAFVPTLGEVPQDMQAGQQALLQQWQLAAGKLEAALGKWQAEDLDKAQVPHPVLGKLTLRELVYFTLYHNQHHVNDAHRLLGLAEMELER